MFISQSASSKKAIIVIQEWWGLNSHMQNITANLQTLLGATAICPDLYRGKVAGTKDEASHLFAALDWKAAIGDIGIAIEYLREQG
jgi:carboxymethylenebutenolidase